MNNIDITDYDYLLPWERIAQYPVEERDTSRLLLFDGNNISSDLFSNLDRFLPGNSLLVFNNTRVIRARLLFHKKSGANIEILCLEPLTPGIYETSFASKGPVEWKCIIGNLKKWKTGSLIMKFDSEGRKYELIAEKAGSEGDAWRIRFCWNNIKMTFSEVIEASGHVPLPPYIDREEEKEDSLRYQTVYSSVSGSVAAPTAGLHFTENLLQRLSQKGFGRIDITLHVGAGTFQPVKTRKISDHIMHCEHFFVSKDTINELLENHGRIIAVGTTSVRTLESLYWLGVKAIKYPESDIDNMKTDQWEPYRTAPRIPVKRALMALNRLMGKHNRTVFSASTQLVIIPGYRFRIVDGIITNFHQPRSTLLLLIAAWTGPDWKNIYKYAIENGFRFLSYGDSSLLYKSRVDN